MSLVYTNQSKKRIDTALAVHFLKRKVFELSLSSLTQAFCHEYLSKNPVVQINTLSILLNNFLE